MKKSILLAIAIAIVGLMITSTASVPMKISTNSVNMDKPMIVERNDLQIIKSDISPYKISAQRLEATSTPIQRLTVGAGPVFAFPGDQLHPAFARSGADMVAAFYDEDMDSIIWTGSNDDGATFIDGVYWDVGGDYPSIKTWDNSPRFFGTFVTDYLDLNGGATYLFECTDPIDTEAYVMTYWDWSGYGWSDMMDADIACDNSQQTFEWGVSSYVISTTHGDGYTDGPTIVYSDEDTEGSAWISWYYYDGCDHTDVDIDRSTIYSYAVYDWEDTTAGYYKLLVRVKDFDQIVYGYDEMFELDYGYNLQFPAVAAGDGNIVILAETDESGNKDIICFYGPDISSMSTSFVVDTGDDERFPDVRHVGGDGFIATYVKGGDLYAAETTDAGATWTESRWQVNDNNDAVVEEYKTSDLCENAVKAMWEEDGPDDIDIFMGAVLSNDPPYPPSDPDPEDGATGVDINADLSWTCSDPDGDTLTYDVYFEANDPTPDVLVSDDQTETTFDPGTLDYETVYYWQIIAEDEFGAVTDGPVWSFTTEEAPVPNLDCSGSLSWTDVTPGGTVTGTITVENIGEPYSLLDWGIESYPEWGTWTFIPVSGDDLLEGDTSTIDVKIVAPDESEETFTGEVVLVNSDDPDDTCIIDVSLATPVSQEQGNQQIVSRFLQIIIERYPVLRQILGL